MNVDPTTLVTPLRLDVFARTEFVRSRVLGQVGNWGRLLYRNFLIANRIDGKESENQAKSTVADYFKSFEKLIDSIMEHGFDSSFGTIPVSESGIVNGAHRLAVALTLNERVIASPSSEPFGAYDYLWFRRSGMGEEFIDVMAYGLISSLNNVRAYVTFGEDLEISDRIAKEISLHAKPIIRKRLGLTEIGQRRLIDLCYGHNDWWEPRLLEPMTRERFEDDAPWCDIVFTQESELDQLRDRKVQLRKLLPQSHFDRKIHGTDYYFDTFFLAEAILNKNSRMFLNTSPIGSEDRIFETLGGPFKTTEPVLARKNWCIDGSSVLEIHGLRRASDIDYIVDEGALIPHELKKQGDDHAQEYARGQADVYELINDPRNHLVYKGVKFLSLQALLLNKFQNTDQKGKLDVGLIAGWVNGTPATYSSSELMQIGRAAGLKYELIAGTDRLLRYLPSRIERSIRRMISGLRKQVSRFSN
jgi:hypothetical protein